MNVRTPSAKGKIAAWTAAAILATVGGAVLAADTSGAPSKIDWTEARQHWAFQPPRPAPPPAVRQKSWPRQPLDSFILAKLEQKGLKPAPEADARTLIRRATFDLTGLPPTREALEASSGKGAR